MLRTCIYLRKSREDIEKEHLGIDTLHAHKTTLLEFAKTNQLNIVAIKEEIVSGGTLSTRPLMLELLEELEQGFYDAVLCMDIDRLGRSGMREQGIILETFQENNVLIITPTKTYDLNNEHDILETDIKSFISRQELSLIKKRMRNGIIRSVKDGNYISTSAPFGYKKVKLSKIKTLEIVEDEAKIVKLIYDLYVSHNMGVRKIADELKARGLKNANSSTNWSITTIKKIIHNPVYTGKVVYASRSYKIDKSGKITSKLNPNALIVEGKHQAIISEELFNKAQLISSARYSPPKHNDKELKNPFSGLIKCGKCGYAMYMKGDGKTFRLSCSHSKQCQTKSTNILKIVERIRSDLYSYFNKLIIELSSTNNDNEIIFLEDKKASILENIKNKKRQQNKLYELLETGVYDIDVFTKRNDSITGEIFLLNNSLNEVDKKLDKIRNINTQNTEPSIINLIQIYDTLSVQDKNVLLKSIINSIIYYKAPDAKPDEFKLIYDMKISD